jgi:hypothetical protein
MNIEYVLSFELDIFAAQYFAHVKDECSLVSSYYHNVYRAAVITPDIVLWAIFGYPARKHYPYRITPDRAGGHVYDLLNDTNDGSIAVRVVNRLINMIYIYNTKWTIKHCIEHLYNGYYVDTYGSLDGVNAQRIVEQMYKRLAHLF